MKELTIGMYVFRIAKGHEGGEPVTCCPVDLKSRRSDIQKALSKIEIEKIPYETNNFTDYLHRELWHCGKLRQGWGIKGLDLNLYEEDQEQWIQNYITGAKQYWDVEITEDYCHVACGRYNVLRHMKEAEIDDLIFIPKHSNENHHDENAFTVCKIVSPYYFDLDDKYKDFGHVRIVQELKTFQYSEETLLPGDFKGYRKGLGKIQEDHLLYKEKRFKSFMKKNFNIKV